MSSNCSKETLYLLCRERLYLKASLTRRRYQITDIASNKPPFHGSIQSIMQNTMIVDYR